MSGAVGGVGGAGGAGGGMGAAGGGGMGGAAGVGGAAGIGGGAGASTASIGEGAVSKVGGQGKVGGMEKMGQMEMNPMEKSIEESKTGKAGGLHSPTTPNANGNDFKVEITNEIKIENNMIDFSDDKLSQKIFDKFSDTVDKALMLALLLAIEKEDRDELLELLKLALLMSAMDSIGGTIDMQG